MIHAFAEKVVNLTPPAAIVNNGSLTVNVLDTFGYDYAVIEVTLGATDIALTALKIQESDVKASGTSLTGGADVVGTRFGTDNNDTGVASTLPSATDDNNVFSIFLDLRGRKRYLLPVVTVGNGTAGAFATVTGRLSRAQRSPQDAASAGYTQRLVV